MSGKKRPKGPEDASTVLMEGRPERSSSRRRRRRQERRARQSAEQPLVGRVEADTALDIPFGRPFMVDPATDETVLRQDHTPVPTAPVADLPAGFSERETTKRRSTRWTAWQVIPLGVLLGLLTGGILSVVILGFAQIMLS